MSARCSPHSKLGQVPHLKYKTRLFCMKKGHVLLFFIVLCHQNVYLEKPYICISPGSLESTSAVKYLVKFSHLPLKIEPRFLKMGSSLRPTVKVTLERVIFSCSYPITFSNEVFHLEETQLHQKVFYEPPRWKYIKTREAAFIPKESVIKPFIFRCSNWEIQSLSAYAEQLTKRINLISAPEHYQLGEKKKGEKNSIINSRPQTQKCPKAASKTQECRETRGTGTAEQHRQSVTLQMFSRCDCPSQSHLF